MKITVFYTTILLALLGMSCSLNYPSGYLERIQEFEENWADCYDKRFNFPENASITSDEYLLCNLDGRNIAINGNTSDFEGTVRYASSWISGGPNTPLSNINGAQYRLHITFLAPDYQRQIALVVKYPLDSLNYTIQKTFDQSEISCSTNFIKGYSSFEISTICDFGSAVFFSTLYSTKSSQHIKIDNFNYRLQDGKWHYHLEYSFDELEITNVHWNSTTKIDILGEERKSNQIENMLVKNMKCVIEFELPEG